jgi:hypothetical protein
MRPRIVAVFVAMATVSLQATAFRYSFAAPEVPVYSPVNINGDSRLAFVHLMRQHPVFHFRIEALRVALQSVHSKMYQNFLFLFNRDLAFYNHETSQVLYASQTKFYVRQINQVTLFKRRLSTILQDLRRDLLQIRLLFDV